MISRGQLLGLLVAAVIAPRRVVPPPSVPQFATGIDLVSVDVQVVNNKGIPIEGLGSDRFAVRIGGETRRVASAEYVAYDQGTSRSGASPAVPGSPAGALAGSQPASRLFVLAIDALSFGVGTSRGVAAAAEQFVAGLPANDQVSLFTFPLGPKVEPTRDRHAIAGALADVVGQREASSTNRFNIRFSELVDIAAGDVQVTASVASRECNGVRVVGRTSTTTADADPGCRTALLQEARSRVLFYEAEAGASLSMLRALFVALAQRPERKVVVLISAGMPLSDRPGGRPDVGDLPLRIGEAAARADAVLYTLFLDASFLERFSAETRKATAADVNVERDSGVAGRWLEQFSGKAGGAFQKVLVGSGESSFNRILNETAGYYLLGVEATAADRDGRPHEITVRVDQRGAIVRARQWVLMPPASQ